MRGRGRVPHKGVRMPVFRGKHPSVDENGNPMSITTGVSVRILAPNGALVKEQSLPFTQPSGSNFQIQIPLTAAEAAAASGGTAEARATAGGLAPADPASAPAPPEGVNPTRTGPVTNFTYTNS